jgi:hypothetical protein
LLLKPQVKIYGEKAMMKMTMVDSSLGEKYKASMQKWEKE